MDNLDKKIINMAKEEKVILPSSYLYKLDATIKSFNQVQERKKWYILHYKLVAMLAVILTAGISVSAFAAVNLYRERMEQMSERELSKMNDDVQQSKANVDSYSREFMASENKRMKYLEKQYEENGVFPKGTLFQVKSHEQYEKDKVCFDSETSTFYFPAREMTDEELLEIIDFRHKRDYSVMKKKQSSSKTQKVATPSNIKLTKLEAEKKAIQMVSEIYNMDLTNYEKEIELTTTKDLNDNSISSYKCNFKQNDLNTQYYVSIDADTGKLNEIRLIDPRNNFYKTGIEFNEEKCIRNKSLVDTILKEGLNLSLKGNKCYLEYKLASDGKLERGNVNYAVKMIDGSGYVFRFSFNMNCIYNIVYVSDFRVYEKSVKSIAMNQKAKGIHHNSILIK